MSTETLLTAPAEGQVDTEAASAGGETLSGTTTQESADTQPGGGESTSAGADSTPGTEGEEGQDSVAGAPETYEDFVAPEGVSLDATVLDSFKATAKELNLPQAAAQRVVDLGVELMAKAAEANQSAIAEAQQGWVQASQSDPEFGGDKLPQSLALAKKGLEAVGSPALMELMEQSGLGNHPEVIRAFRKVGELHAEDSLVNGNGHEGGQDKSPAKRIYANMN